MKDPVLKELASAEVRSVPWTAWVDQQGLLRRLHLTVEVPNGVSVVTRAGYSGWGKPATINPPPADHVATIND